MNSNNETNVNNNNNNNNNVFQVKENKSKNVLHLEESNNNSGNYNGNSVKQIYKYMNKIKKSGSINEEQIITLFNSFLDEISTLKESLYNESIPKEILVTIIDKSSDFEDFKEKINKFNQLKLSPFNKNYDNKLKNYAKNVLKM